ncbi:MAG TPA: hypothetical protein VGM22_18005 [Methylomirabilota bacterium]
MRPLIAVAAVTLSQALQIAIAHRRPLPMVLVTLALVASLLAVLRPEWLRAREADRARRWAAILVGAVVLWQIFQLAASVQAVYMGPGRRLALIALVVGATGAVVVIGAELAGSVRLVRWRLPLLVAIHFACGAWIIHASPRPFIDVYVFHVEALRVLGQGLDPYGRTIPNIYDHEAFYGPGVVVSGRVQSGFPYPPLSLLMAGVGHVLGGDFRFANVAAMGLAALLIGTCRPGALVAAALFLFTPRMALVLEQGWTEPYVVLLLAATVWCALRAPALVPVALGLFFAVKQYTVLAAPLVVLLYPGPAPWRDAARALAKAALVAVVVTLPFVVADPSAFARDVIALQFRQPFRADSLSYPAAWLRATGRMPPAWPAFVLAPLALAVGLWRAPRTPAGFALAVALTFLVFFAFNKQAFVNYYFFLVGALCCALAAAGPAPDARATPL